MRLLRHVLLAATLLLAGSSAASETVRVRGELVWNAERQTLSPCGSDLVYWVRVLASNPHFWLSERVEALSGSQPGNAGIIADLEGERSGVPSAGPTYSVDHVLYVSGIHSVERGSCESGR